MTMDGLPPLREVIDHYDLQAKKSLGQNFLFDLNLTSRIARATQPMDCPIVEIGPGPGALTRALLMEGAQKLICVEADRRFEQPLRDIKAAYGDRLELVFADAMTLHPDELCEGPYKICANLPYNIGTPLYMSWLETSNWPPRWTSLTLMFQKEVADRVVAPAGSKAYGRLSILSQWLCHNETLFDIDPRAFVPPPKITSSVIQITPRDEVLAPASLPALKRVTTAAFGQRRKMLRASLKQLGVDPIQLLSTANIEETRRAETLTIEEFCTLARCLEALKFSAD